MRNKKRKKMWKKKMKNWKKKRKCDLYMKQGI